MARTSTQTKEAAASYLKKPYARLIIPEDDGTFRGEIIEFPGCIVAEDTREETLVALENAAQSWLEACINHGKHIPEPIDAHDYSGKMVLRLPRSLHKKAAMLAERDGVSLNQFIVTSLAEQVGERANSGSAHGFGGGVFIGNVAALRVDIGAMNAINIEAGGASSGVAVGGYALAVGSSSGTFIPTLPYLAGASKDG